MIAPGWLLRLEPCTEAARWVEAHEATTAEALWQSCPRGDWLLWIAARIGIDRRLIVEAACDCAAEALVYVPAGKDRPRRAIETARRWARGEATLEEVAAYAYDYDDYDTACACAADAAAYAVRAVVRAADAADAAARAAEAAEAADAEAARLDSLSRSADLVRARIPRAAVVAAIDWTRLRALQLGILGGGR